MFPAPPGYEGRPPREWPVPPMDHEAGWKQSAYTLEMGLLILARIWAGETVKQVTADPRMPSYATVYQWVRVHDGFGEAWVDLRQALAGRALRAEVQAQAERAAIRAFRQEMGLEPKRRGGKPSTYTRARGQAVCRRVADGAALYRVLAEPGMPSPRAVYRWLQTEPAFRRAYHDACAARTLGLWVDTHRVMDEVREGADLRAGKAMVARIEGRIGQLIPKKYRALP